MPDDHTARQPGPQPGPRPGPGVKTPNPFLLFVEVAAVAVATGYLAYVHLAANLVFAMICGIVLGFGAVLTFNMTRLRPLLVPVWAATLGAAAWHFGWGPVGIALAVVTGAAIKLAEMRFLDRHRA